MIVPLSGIALRAFVTNWGYGAKLAEVLTLDHFQSVFDEPTLVRAIWNTILIGTVGGAIAVACYTAIGFATHRRNDGWSRFVDYLVLVPRAVPGLLAGLGVPVGVPVLPAAAAAAHDDLQHVARLHRRLAGLRHAAHLVVADAGLDRTGRGRAHRRRAAAARFRARSRCR